MSENVEISRTNFGMIPMTEVGTNLQIGKSSQNPEHTH